MALSSDNLPNHKYGLIEQIHRTLEVRDPKKVTVCVGSAAIAACLAEAGYNHQAEDVDVLCPPDYFDDLITNSKHLTGGK